MLTDPANLRVLWDGQCQLGEGPLYCAKSKSVYWVDILGRAVHQVSLSGEAHQSWLFDSAPTSISHHTAGGFMLTMRKGFARWQPGDGAPTLVANLESNLPNNRFNDAKTDRHGNLWAGSMDDEGLNNTGSLYRLRTDGTIQVMDTGYCISNGPAFSPCGKWLYHTNSNTRQVYRFQLNDDGTISNKALFIQIVPEHGYPDGMTVSADGDLWICHFAGGRISRFDRAGQLKLQYRLPVSNVTSCAFVGPELNQLAITTARKELSPQQLLVEPLAGALFIADVDAIGVPVQACGNKGQEEIL